MTRFGQIAFAVLFALYPLAVYAGLRAGNVRWAAFTLAAAACLQAMSSRLVFFASSLSGESVIEKLARLKEPDLPAAGRRYCRRLTLVWCAFFVLNGLIAFDSAGNRTEVWWALYNGLIAYVLIGCLFAGEWLIRLRIRKRSP